jgi:hypothetical protein
MDALAARDEAKKALRKKIDAETSAQIREQVRYLGHCCHRSGVILMLGFRHSCKLQIETNARLKEQFQQKTLEEEQADLAKVRILWFICYV